MCIHAWGKQALCVCVCVYAHTHTHTHIHTMSGRSGPWMVMWRWYHQEPFKRATSLGVTGPWPPWNVTGWLWIPPLKSLPPPLWCLIGVVGQREVRGMIRQLCGAIFTEILSGKLSHQRGVNQHTPPTAAHQPHQCSPVDSVISVGGVLRATNSTHWQPETGALTVICKWEVSSDWQVSCGDLLCVCDDQ